MSNSVPDSAPKPRACHVKKWSDFNGYGFNLHAEKGKAGQFIGKVDAGSPADAAGLKEGDRIIEVNGTNIGNENHSQVVQRIKAVSNETKLLVVDDETDDYFKNEKIVIRGDMPYVESIECPDEMGGESIRSSAAPSSNNQDDDIPEPQVSDDQDEQDVEPEVLEEEEHIAGSEQQNEDEYHDDIDDDDHRDAPEEVEEQQQQQRQEDDYEDVPEQEDIAPEQDYDDPHAAAIVMHHEDEDEEDIDDIIDFGDIEEAAASAPAVVSSSDGGPPPRQCHLVIWPDFSGYGFNLHAEKGKPGQFIGKVDPGSPAEAAGLRPGDRIVEVNGVFIGEDNHGQVVQKIKSDANRTTMLVVDEAAENYYRDEGIQVSSTLPNVQNIRCPATKAEYSGAPKVEEAEVVASPAPVAVSSAPAPVSSAPADDGPAPRLCHLKVWSDYQGYGFNLHAQKGKGGQYVGKVDAGSPAEAAGLKEGDKIVEVNDKNVANEEHKAVVAGIKSDATQTRLLVVDEEAFNYYKERDITVNGDMSNVNRITCPDSKGLASPPPSEPKPTPAPVVTSTSTAAAPAEETGPAPRRCILKVWSDFSGYGFNLHAEKGQGGSYIGAVDAGGPAEAAGLIEDDKIIEINGTNVTSFEHAAVVTEIKSDPKQVSMLVVDPATFEYYRGKGVAVNGSMSNVKTITCPDSKPLANGVEKQTEAEVVYYNKVNGASSSEEAEVRQEAPPTQEEEPEYDVNENEPFKSEAEVNGISEGDEAAAAIEDSIREAEREVEKEEAAAAVAAAATTSVTSTSEEEQQQKMNEELDALQDYEVVERREEPETQPEPVAAEPEPVPEKVEESSASYVNTVSTEDTYDDTVAVQDTYDDTVKRDVNENTTTTTTTTTTAVAEEVVKKEEKQVERPQSEAIYEEPETSSKSTPAAAAQEPPKSPSVMVGGIEFSGSAKEARERLSKRSSRKHEVKKQEVSMRDKFELFQKL